MAYRNKLGYGVLGGPNRTTVLAHRIAFELTIAPIPSGAIVCHHCDNPPCVRPDHLFLGTHKDNARDCQAKGRKPIFRGASNGNTKLLMSTVNTIRTKYASGQVGIIKLASEFGVSKSQIWNIVSGREWNEVV